MTEIRTTKSGTRFALLKGIMRQERYANLQKEESILERLYNQVNSTYKCAMSISNNQERTEMLDRCRYLQKKYAEQKEWILRIKKYQQNFI